MHIDDSSTQFLVNKIQTDFYTESERKRERGTLQTGRQAGKYVGKKKLGIISRQQQQKK